jgi:excisionase family DNA binding protein
MIYTIDDIMRKLDSIESNIQTNKSNNELMTIRDIVRYTSFSDATIRRYIRRGKLKPFKEDGKKLFRRTDVDKWLQG